MSEATFHEYRLQILKIAQQKEWAEEVRFLELLKPEYLLSEVQRNQFRELYFKLAFTFSTNGNTRIILAQHWSGTTTQLLAKMLAYVSLRYSRPDIYSDLSVWSRQRELLEPVYASELAHYNERGLARRQMSYGDFYAELENLYKVSGDLVSEVEFLRELTPANILTHENLDRLSELIAKVEMSGNPWVFTFYQPLARILSFTCLEYSRPLTYLSFIQNLKNKEFFLKIFFEELAFERLVNQFRIRRIVDDELEGHFESEITNRTASSCFLKLQH